MGLTRITSDGITDGSIVNADLHNSAAIAKTKLASLDIVNADVNASAAIAMSKLALSITNAEINASAAIAGTKISPVFGAQTITGAGGEFTGNVIVNGNNGIKVENTYPRIFLTDTNNDSDYSIINNNGEFRIYDDTNGANRLRIFNSGTVNIPSNTDFGAGIDVTGNITVTGTVDGVDLQTLNTAVSANTAKVTNATHTGDVTGATSLTIADDAVTYAKIQNVTQDRILGRQSSGTGVVQELNAANVRTMINVEDGATASSPEVYGFNTNASGNLIVTTTNGGVDNISGTAYDAFDEVVFASTGFTFSLNASGNLIATI